MQDSGSFNFPGGSNEGNIFHINYFDYDCDGTGPAGTIPGSRGF